MNQDWRDLTFVHWAVDPERVAARMPPGVRPDVLEGRTYVGLVPFLLADAAPGRARGVPWLGTFLETNIRLYSVDSTGRRGVVFLSLDCERLPVVAGAQAVFGLPYRWARMAHRRSQGPAGEEHVYSARLLRRGSPVTNRVVVRVGSSKAEPTELDHFLSARWGLHTRRLGRTLYVPNRHGVWPLRSAELLQLDDGLLASVGLGELASRTPDHVAFSPGVHTEFGFPLDARRHRANGPPGGPATRRRADR
jgi:uncharacterized protein YqjF (DUF2071 family)